MTDLREKLKHDLIKNPQIICVVAGIGVSLTACNNARCATWKGLLEHGLEICKDVCGTNAELLAAHTSIIKNPASPTHALIGVGQFITDELKKKHPGAFGAWMENSIGKIQHRNPSLSRAIAALGVKIATTNYDAMIEEGTARTPITWKDHAQANSFFRNERNDILHLHGFYREHDSIVLGARSYEEICSDEMVQHLLRGAMMVQTLVFVGCGAGLEDPNFGTLLEWTRRVLAKSTHSHYILVRSSEIEEWQKRLQGILIYPIPYGESHSELTPFVESLAKDVSQARNAGQLPGLLAVQTDFETNWRQLESSLTPETTLAFFQKSHALAAALREAGGRRRAATEFSNRVASKGGSLEPVFKLPESIKNATSPPSWLSRQGRWSRSDERAVSQ